MRTVEEIKADIKSISELQTTDLFEQRSKLTKIHALESELQQTVISDIPLDRLETICAAEKDGRLVTLPCKVGDTINAFRYSKEKGGLYILSDKVTSVTTNKNGYTVKTKSVFYPIKQKEGYDFAQISKYPNACADYYVGERAEAEKALGKEQGHDD